MTDATAVRRALAAGFVLVLAVLGPPLTEESK